MSKLRDQLRPEQSNQPLRIQPGPQPALAWVPGEKNEKGRGLARNAGNVQTGWIKVGEAGDCSLRPWFETFPNPLLGYMQGREMQSDIRL